MATITQAPSTTPVLTRNQQRGPTVFTDRTLGIHIEWKPKNDPNGEDYQEVPSSLLNHHQFTKAVRRGVITIESDSPEVQEALEAQAGVLERQREANKEALDTTLDNEPSRDYVTEACIGPATRGVGNCGADVPVQQQNKGERPPLCSQHEHLAAKFVLMQTEELDDEGVAITKWTQVTMDPTPLPSQEG